MCARVVVEGGRMELQQRQIEGSMRENKELLGCVKEGLEENMRVLRANIEMLKRRKAAKQGTPSTA